MWQSWCLRNFHSQYSIYISPAYSSNFFSFFSIATYAPYYLSSLCSLHFMAFNVFFSLGCLLLSSSSSSLSGWLLGDVLDQWPEDGHLLGEAGLGALFLLHAHILWREVTDAVVKALLRSVEEVLGLRLEINEGTWVVALSVLFVHY